MNMRSLILAAAFYLTASACQAGIVYEWQGVKKKSPSEFSLLLEFDEATVKSGHFILNIENGNNHVRPASGLLYFYTPHGGYHPREDVFARGLEDSFLRMNVYFSDGNFLSGGISVFDMRTELNMSTTRSGPLWAFHEQMLTMAWLTVLALLVLFAPAVQGIFVESHRS